MKTGSLRYDAPFEKAFSRYIDPPIYQSRTIENPSLQSRLYLPLRTFCCTNELTYLLTHLPLLSTVRVLFLGPKICASVLVRLPSVKDQNVQLLEWILPAAFRTVDFLVYLSNETQVAMTGQHFVFLQTGMWQILTDQCWLTLNGHIKTSEQRAIIHHSLLPQMEHQKTQQYKTRTLLTRRVSSYGLPAWVSSELGPMGGQPLQRPQQHWKRVTTKGAFHQSRYNLIWIRIRGQPDLIHQFLFHQRRSDQNSYWSRVRFDRRIIRGQISWSQF